MTEAEKAQRAHLENCSDQLSALADEVDVRATEFRALVSSAFQLDGQIRELSGRIATADINEVRVVLDELSGAVRKRMETQAKAQDLQMRLSGNSHSIRHLSGQVRPKRLLDTIGRKVFHNAA